MLIFHIFLLCAWRIICPKFLGIPIHQDSKSTKNAKLSEKQRHGDVVPRNDAQYCNDGENFEILLSVRISSSVLFLQCQNPYLPYFCWFLLMLRIFLCWLPSSWLWTVESKPSRDQKAVWDWGTRLLTNKKGMWISNHWKCWTNWDIPSGNQTWQWEIPSNTL